MSDPKPPKSMNLRALCEALAVKDEKTIRGWVKAGCPHHKGPGRTGALTFEKAEVVAWMRELGRTGQPGRPPAEVSLLSPMAAPVADVVKAAGAGAARPRKAVEAESREELLTLTAQANLAIKQLEAQKRERQEREAERELVPLAEAQRFIASLLQRVVAELEAAPGRIASEAAGQPHDVVFAVAERVINGCRANLAEAFHV